MWSSGGIGQSTLKDKKKEETNPTGATGLLLCDLVPSGSAVAVDCPSLRLSVFLSSIPDRQGGKKCPMRRLLTQNQKKKKQTNQKTPNLKTQHGSAFFQHAETLNDLNERNQSLFFSPAS